MRSVAPLSSSTTSIFIIFAYLYAFAFGCDVLNDTLKECKRQEKQMNLFRTVCRNVAVRRALAGMFTKLVFVSFSENDRYRMAC